MQTVLLVDDLPAARRLLYHALKESYHVLEAHDAGSALGAIRTGPVDLVILDLHLPPDASTPREGMRLQRTIAGETPRIPVVVTTGDQDRGLALEMVQAGVADFLLKPIDPAVLKIVVARALERATLERELADLRREVSERHSFAGLVGRSAAMREVFSRLERLAAAPITVLLLGESGTGKSAVARAIHEASPRARRPFVVVDGATIPEGLLESELFGHLRGAFTGADAAKAGRIQAADGGTLFLDEIGNLTRPTQEKLLRFLDTRAYTPVGSSQETRVDVRLVAATNRDLPRMVAEKSFREDLLFRLQVATVVLPPLRERREDIPWLAESFLARLSRDGDYPRARLTGRATAALESQDWPGNVRQLRHVLENSLAVARSEILDASDLILPPPPAGADKGSEAGAGAPLAPAEPGAAAQLSQPERLRSSFKRQVASFEKDLLERALKKSRGNKAAAGRLLGLDENRIRYLLRKHGLR